jgi:hypothetical protein
MYVPFPRPTRDQRNSENWLTFESKASEQAVAAEEERTLYVRKKRKPLISASKPTCKL